jgi:hypothetical protein
MRVAFLFSSMRGDRRRDFFSDQGGELVHHSFSRRDFAVNNFAAQLRVRLQTLDESEFEVCASW